VQLAVRTCSDKKSSQRCSAMGSCRISRCLVITNQMSVMSMLAAFKLRTAGRTWLSRLKFCYDSTQASGIVQVRLNWCCQVCSRDTCSCCKNTELWRTTTAESSRVNLQPLQAFLLLAVLCRIRHISLQLC
jgi:hypothetical protein